jgi:transposase-like protein
MSTRDTSSFLGELGVERSHVAVHSWVQKAELQPGSEMTANQLAVDEMMICVHGLQYWQYGVADQRGAAGMTGPGRPYTTYSCIRVIL